MATKHLSAADIAAGSHLRNLHTASLQDVHDRLDFLLYMYDHMQPCDQKDALDRAVDEWVEHEAILKGMAS